MAPQINFRIPIAEIERKLEGARARLGGEPTDLAVRLAASLDVRKTPQTNCRIGRQWPAAAPAHSDIIAANAAAGVAALLSPSQLKTFFDCQARWKFEKIDELPSRANANLAIGSAVHEALAYQFAQKISSGKDLPIPEVKAAFDAAWPAVLSATELTGDDNPEQLAATGRALLDVFMRQGAYRIQPIAVELEVAGAIGGVPVRGFVDVLDIDARVHDFKTRKTSPNGWEPADVFQLATYTALVPGASGEGRIHGLIKTKTPKYVQLTRTIEAADVAAIETQYPLAQEAMRSGLYMPNRNSNLCSRRNCSYWAACESEFGGKVPLT